MVPLLQVRSQGTDLVINVEPRDPCVAGYPCEVNVSVENRDGTILLDYVKLITPWGAFTRNLGLRELRPNSTATISIAVNVDRNSLEGPNFVRPIVRYFRKGEVGLKLIEGNASSLLVVKPHVNATLLVIPQSKEISLGRPLSIQVSYSVRGVPADYKPSISVYVDGRLSMRRELNSTSGELDFSIPMSPEGSEGNHTVIVSLCYGIGCIDRSFEVYVRRSVKVVPGYNKEDLTRMLEAVRAEREEVQAAYTKAVELGLPVPEDVLLNLTIVNSKIKEAESLLSQQNISYADVLKIESLLKQSSHLLSNIKDRILSLYRERIEDMLMGAREDVEKIRKVNQTEYEELIGRIVHLSSRIGDLNLTEAPDFYSNVSREVNVIEERIRALRRKAEEEARLLSGITVSLIFVAMISGATIILRKWKSQLLRE